MVVNDVPIVFTFNKLVRGPHDLHLNTDNLVSSQKVLNTSVDVIIMDCK